MTGIGVLILFIALVLVAAIASGLILDTAGVLQNTAQDTGEQSTAEVSDRISILSVSGDVPEDTRAIERLRLTVYKSPGSSEVNLQQLTIEYFSPHGTAFLIHEDEFDAMSDDNLTDFTEDLGTFDVEAVKDPDASTPVLSARGDRASVLIPLYNDPQGSTTSGDGSGDGSGDSSDDNTIPSGEPDAVQYLTAGDSATIRLTTQEGATSMHIVNVPESLAGNTGGTVLL